MAGKGKQDTGSGGAVKAKKPDVEALIAENERLRAALQRIVDEPASDGVSHYSWSGKREIARRALEAAAE